MSKLALTCVVVALSVGTSTALGQPAPQGTPGAAPANQTNTDSERKEQWQRSLRRAFQGFSSAIVVDVNLKDTPAYTQFASQGNEKDHVDLMAAFVKREVRDLSFGWALVRTPDTAPSAYATYAALSRWLSQVPEDELAGLCGGGVAYANLSRGTRLYLAKLCSNPGLQMKMANGEFASATLRMAFLPRVKDKNGEPVKSVLEPLRKDSNGEQALRDKLEKTYEPPTVKPTAKRTLTGDLDFGEGEILTLTETISKAGKAFGKTYICDGRMANSTYYWQGRFDPKTFEEYLKAVAVPYEPKLQDPDLDEALGNVDKALRYKIAGLLDPSLAPNGLTYKDALDGKSLTAGELAKLVPGWGSVLQQRGIDPSAQVTLAAAISLNLVAPGSTADRPGESPLGNSWGVVFWR